MHVHTCGASTLRVRFSFTVALIHIQWNESHALVTDCYYSLNNRFEKSDHNVAVQQGAVAERAHGLK